MQKIGKFFFDILQIELKDFVKYEKLKNKKVSVKFVFVDNIYYR